MKIHFHKQVFDIAYCIGVTHYISTHINRKKVKDYPYRISFNTSDFGIENSINEELSYLKRGEYEIQSVLSKGEGFSYNVTVFFKNKNDLLRYKLKSGNV